MKKIKNSKAHSRNVNTWSNSDRESQLLREYAKLSYDQLMREEMKGNPAHYSALAASKEHEPIGVPVVLFNSKDEIIAFVSAESEYDDDGIPRSCSVETEENIAAAAASVGWLSPIPSYGIPIEGGEDAFIVSGPVRKQAILIGEKAGQLVRLKAGPVCLPSS
jgi:hypothetical protein